MPFVTDSIAQQLEDTHTWRCIEYAQAQAQLQPDTGSEVRQIADGYAVYAGPYSPLNKASGLGFKQVVTGDDLDELEWFYHHHQALPRIELCPLADDSLLNLLEARGYRLELFFNVLFRPVPRKPLSVNLPPDTHIRRVLPSEAGIWIHTTTQGFQGYDDASETALMLQAPNFYSENTLSFLAWVGKEPAAGGGMAFHHNATVFGGTSTRSKFRRRGLQTALLNTRLNIAREMGCKLVMTLTFPGSASQRNVQRAGFHLAYTKPLMVRV